MRKTIFTKQALACLACSLVMLAGVAHAADVQQITSMASGKNWTMTNDGATTPKNYFDDGQAAHSGVDYFVGRNRAGNLPAGQTGTITLRPVAGADATFPGNSLTVDTDGQLSLKPADNGNSNYNYPNLTIKGAGTLTQAANSGNANTTATVTVPVMLAGTPIFKATDNMDRTMIFDGPINGSGLLTLSLVPNTTGRKMIYFNSNDSTFNGSIVQNNGFFYLGASKALGSTQNLTINAPGTLLTTVNVNAAVTTLTLNTTAILALTHQVNFGACIINGKRLANGTYKSADLQTSFAANITNNGGTLIVGPPPNKVRNSWLFN